MRDDLGLVRARGHVPEAHHQARAADVLREPPPLVVRDVADLLDDVPHRALLPEAVPARRRRPPRRGRGGGRRGGRGVGEAGRHGGRGRGAHRGRGGHHDRADRVPPPARRRGRDVVVARRDE